MREVGEAALPIADAVGRTRHPTLISDSAQRRPRGPRLGTRSRGPRTTVGTSLCGRRFQIVFDSPSGNVGREAGVVPRGTLAVLEHIHKVLGHAGSPRQAECRRTFLRVFSRTAILEERMETPVAPHGLPSVAQSEPEWRGVHRRSRRNSRASYGGHPSLASSLSEGWYRYGVTRKVGSSRSQGLRNQRARPVVIPGMGAPVDSRHARGASLELGRLPRTHRPSYPDAPRELVEHCQALVWKLVRAHRSRSIPDEDLVQEVFLKLFSRLDRYEPRDGIPFEHWLSRSRGPDLSGRASDGAPTTAAR